MSIKPYPDAPFGNDPTGAVFGNPSALPAVLACFASRIPTNGNFSNFGARAAYSHSASVGSRLPTHSQYLVASNHDTPVIGCFSGVTSFTGASLLSLLSSSDSSDL